MHTLLRLSFALLFFSTMTFSVFGQAPQPGYVPPDIELTGISAHNEHLAVIETTCRTDAQALDLRDKLIRAGALVSIITSPDRMLAWVPPSAKDAVMNTRLESATDNAAQVRSISYSSAEFARNRDPNQTEARDSEADRAIVEYLDFIKRPLTEEDRLRIREREMEIREEAKRMPPRSCVTIIPTDETGLTDTERGEEENRVDIRTELRGYIVHTAFFLESKSGTGSWDWDATVYTRYRNFYIAGINYWTSFAARYGKTITTRWRLYSPYHSNSEVDGEPVNVGEDVYIKEVLKPIVTWPFLTLFPNKKSHTKFCQRYNKMMRKLYSADEAVCGFICYKPSGDEAVWPHAKVLEYGNGDREGVYFTMDTRYWQAEEDPFSAPLRNVIAHEIGHLWGAPDEYRTDNCGDTYNGMPNINCQTTRPAYGRSGTMQGWDGMMKGNYTAGNSIATPVHAGVIAESETAPLRMFDAEPIDVQLEFFNCDAPEDIQVTTPIGIPVDFDYCHRIEAPAKQTRGGTDYYFSHWEVERESGTSTDVSSHANVLPSHAYGSTFGNPVTDVTAIYTDDPPDFLSANNTLSAEFATRGGGGSPPPAIALRWKSNFDMNTVDTEIEYRQSAGNWIPLDGNHYLGQPHSVNIGQWTGALVLSVPDGSGGTNDIQSGTTYEFRIVGVFNDNRGTPSSTASITTRSGGASNAYCADSYEPNSTSSPADLPSSDKGMADHTIEAGIALQPVVGEFSFNVPQWDYYRIAVNDVSSSVFGERLELRLRVKEGSDFEPRFRARRLGDADHIHARKIDDKYVLSLRVDGTYHIKVESEVTGSTWNDLVHPNGGHFSFGEYEITLARWQPEIDPYVPELCIGCVQYDISQPIKGQVIMRPHPKYELFREGLEIEKQMNFNMYYQVPAGYSFLGFGGDLGTIQENPAQLEINSNTESGRYEIYPIIQPISEALAELVVIHPEGLDGPMEARESASVGSMLTASAQVPEGYEFAGWGGDTTAMTNPLPVTMWRSKRVIAYYRKKPCIPEPMTAWNHEITYRNADQNRITMEYGMASGAGDGLEAGQTDLPPVPPPSAFDIRWLNIPGSQGSHTDLRAIQSSHTFQGQVQTGSANPVTMEWTSPPVTPDASFTLDIQGVPGSIDMHTQNSYTFADAGRYIFTVKVEESGCPEPTKENDIIVVTDEVDTDEWPCIDLKLKMHDSMTGELRPFSNPYNVRLMERMPTGEMRPTLVRTITQRDSLVIYRLCPEDDDPERPTDIVIINDNEDEEQKEDTVMVPVDPPIPDGDGDPERFVLRPDGDWEMVSVPLELVHSDAGTVFGSNDYTLYQFDAPAGQYMSANGFELGRGYWLKTEMQEKTLVGLSKPSLTMSDLSGIGEPYGYGWNMIGTLNQTIQVSAIEQQPASALQAIFGWDPSQGYVIPTELNPGEGYWVRVEPDATLRISTSGVRGSGTPTGYGTAAAALDIAGILSVENDDGHTRTLYATASSLTDAQRDALMLPSDPPPGAMHVRTDEHTRYFPPGESTVYLRDDGRCVLNVHSGNHRMRIELRDERDRLLHVFDDDNTGQYTLDVNGERILKLNTTVRPLPAAVALGNNYPDPFHGSASTVIPFTLERDGIVRLRILDMLGRQVRLLEDGMRSAGTHIVRWDGRDDGGRPVSAGMYNYRLETAQGTDIRTLTIVK